MRIAAFHNLPSGGAKRALVEMISQPRAADDTVDVFVPSTADEAHLPSSEVASSASVVHRGQVRRRRADTLSALARKHGVELMIRTGLDEPELVAAYQSAGVLACAAELEPFGLTTLEAGATGAVVVAVREGWYRETVIDGVTSEWIGSRDPKAMGRQIDAVLSSRARLHNVRSRASGWEG